MRIALTALVFMLGMFDLFMAVSFLLNPVEAGAGLGLAAPELQGVSTLRADFTAFFGVIGVCAMVGAWRRNADMLLVPALLMGTAVTVRAISLALDGSYPAWQVPMLVEIIHVALLVAAWRILPHHKIEELTS